MTAPDNPRFDEMLAPDGSVPSVTVGLQQTNLDLFGQQKTRKPLFMRVFWISLDYFGLSIGGGGGN